MQDAGKAIVAMGVVLALVGAVVWALGRLGFRGLPGDIVYRSDRVTFYFPIVTCLVLSALLTAVAWLWHWFRRG